MTATPTITPDELTRAIEAINAGLEPAEAIEAIWGEPKPEKKPVVMVTEFPDGIVIGWDTCSAANGGCGNHITKCKCAGGPKALKVFDQWRSGEKTMPDYGAAATAAKAAGVPSTMKGGTEVGVVVATQPKPAEGQVPCKEGEHFVPLAEAEKNDDGTWTCFACQEASTGGVQVDG